MAHLSGKGSLKGRGISDIDALTSPAGNGIVVENGIITRIDDSKVLEEEFGRERGVPRFSPRTIDIDVLLFGIQDGKDCAIDLPRDEITKHAFVLQPLAELLPDNVHPQTGSSYSAMWEEFDDPSQELAVIEFDWSGIGEN